MTYTHLIGPHDRFRTADCATSYSLRNDGRVSLRLGVVAGFTRSDSLRYCLMRGRSGLWWQGCNGPTVPVRLRGWLRALMRGLRVSGGTSAPRLPF